MLSEGDGTGNERSRRLALLCVFFLSGASGLVYEVVWSRSLVLVFGSTTHAVSTVLAAFMGGLALGSALVGRRGDRFASPLRVYAMLEVAIAAASLAVMAVLPALVPLYRLAWNLGEGSPALITLMRFLLASLVLLAPTTLMGATLPILSAHLEREPSRGSERSGTGAGALYAANTIGAVAGTALTGFLLLPALGMKGAAFTAAGANLVAALAALRLARAASAARPADEASPIDAPEIAPLRPEAAAAPDAIPFPILLAVFAASGAGALIFEVVWTRILSLVLGSSTQAFTIMLTTFLAGLAIGSAVTTRLLPRIPDAARAFTLIELGAGITALGGVYLFPELPYAFLRLFAATGDAPILFDLGRFLLASLVMLPPTLLLGAAFPLAARVALRRGGGAVSTPVAALYTANTIGAIAGSCAAGFLLVPWIGLQSSLLAGCALNVAAAALILTSTPSRRPAIRYALPALLILALPGLVTAMPPWNATVMTSGVFQYAPRYLQQFRSRREFLDYHAANAQLYYRDGPTTTVTVEKRPERVEGKVNTVLSVNGKVDASSVGDMDTQVLLGQLPMLVARDPRTALVIGLGSGVSAGSVLTHPVEQVAIVEIEPAVIEAQIHFETVNGRPLSDPRTTVRVNDARNELLMSDRAWDVIISEPSNPWIAGPSKLFTREFFELARSRLSPGGLLCQWVQLYGMDADALKTLLRTYASVFPHRMVFKGSPGDLVILGGAEPIRLDLDAIARRMKTPLAAADLARVRIGSPEDLLARFRMGDADFETFVGAGSGRTLADSGPLNTDDNALIEFAAARSLYRDDHQANDVLMAEMPVSLLPHLDLAAGPTGRARAEAELAAGLSSRLVKSGLLARAGALLDAADAAGPADPATRALLLSARGDLLSRKGDAAGAEKAWREALALEPFQPRATIGLAGRRLASGDPAEAARLLETAADRTGDRICLLELGRARLAAGEPSRALAAIARLESAGTCSGLEEGHDAETGPLIHLHAGRALVALGRYEEGRRHLRLYFDLFAASPRPAETSIDAASDLARACVALGDTGCAIAENRRIVGLADSLASWNQRQASQAVERGDLGTAEASLRAALHWNGRDNRVRRLLARTLNDLGRREEALAEWRRLDADASGDEEALKNIAGQSLALRRPADAIEALTRLREIEDDPASIREIDDTIRRLASGTRPLPAPAQGGAPVGELR